MLFDRICGQLPTQSAEINPSIREPDDWIDLQWYHCLRRAARYRSRGGATVRIMLGLGERLQHHSLLTNGSTTLGVHLSACEVLIARPQSFHETGMVALGMGNLHLPVQVTGSTLITIADGPVEDMLVRLGIEFEKQMQRFEPDPIPGMPLVQFSADFEIARRGATR